MPKKTAFLFPGQGSQFVGMGRELYDHYQLVRDTFAQADETLGRPLGQILFEGPEEELKKTENTQPGLYTVSIAAAVALATSGVRIQAVAGHSLGEYSALAAANVFEWTEGLKLVQTRGRLMSQAAEANPGAMAAILGLEPERVETACKTASAKGTVVPANFNGPGQIVISGERPAVEAGVEECKALGAKRAILLPVHGAFHSPLMETAVKPMRDALFNVPLNEPAVDFVANVTGDMMRNPESIRESLVRQINACVQWTKTMETLIESGIELFIEVGPGKVLAGIAKRVSREIKVMNCSTPADVDKILEVYSAE